MVIAKMCPDCKELPTQFKVKDYDKKDAVELACEKHGHRAMGKDLPQAEIHWNIYVEFVEASRKAAKAEGK